MQFVEILSVLGPPMVQFVRQDIGKTQEVDCASNSRGRKKIPSDLCQSDHWKIYF